MPSLVLYDEACPPCCDLARFAARRAADGVAFVGWRAYAATEEGRRRLGAVDGRPVELMLLTDDGRLLAGVDAWEALLAALPDLAPLTWLAGRLGLTRAVAGAARGGGALLRGLCRGCPRPAPWTRGAPP